MPGQVEGKVVLVTGGSSRIGKAAALVFARERAKVVIASRSQEKGSETLRLIQASGAEAMWIQADVTQAGQVEAMVHKVVEAYGRLDFAFNNVRTQSAVQPPVETLSSSSRLMVSWSILEAESEYAPVFWISSNSDAPRPWAPISSVDWINSSL